MIDILINFMPKLEVIKITKSKEKQSNLLHLLIYILTQNIEKVHLQNVHLSFAAENMKVILKSQGILVLVNMAPLESVIFHLLHLKVCWNSLLKKIFLELNLYHSWVIQDLMMPGSIPLKI